MARTAKKAVTAKKTTKKVTKTAAKKIKLLSGESVKTDNPRLQPIRVVGERETRPISSSGTHFPSIDGEAARYLAERSGQVQGMHASFDSTVVSNYEKELEESRLEYNRTVAIGLSNLNKRRLIAREAFIDASELDLSDALTSVSATFIATQANGKTEPPSHSVAIVNFRAGKVEKMYVDYLKKLLDIEESLTELTTERQPTRFSQMPMQLLDGNIASAIYMIRNLIGKEINNCKLTLTRTWAPLLSNSNNPYQNF